MLEEIKEYRIICACVHCKHNKVVDGECYCIRDASQHFIDSNGYCLEKEID